MRHDLGSDRWVIHPQGFSAAPLLELGRLQGWTLKPARLTRRIRPPLALTPHVRHDLGSNRWVIHPQGFSAVPLLKLGRLQGWTLKPARLTR